jgi:phage-related baseplate assembly protein
MNTFSAINLERLPAPQIIEQPDFPTIFAARKARLIELAPHLAPALELESEPLVQLLQEDSYRELLLRAAIQDGGKGNLLAFAEGAMLEHIGAFYGVGRLVVQVADPSAVPPVDAVLESDESLRRRIQLAPEGFTTAGSEGSYIFWALSGSPDVKDVAISSPEPRHVTITVLSRIGDGAPSQELLDAVDASTQPRRPLTDLVLVEEAAIVTYEVHAVLTLFNGPDAEVVRVAAENSLQSYVAEHHKLGHDITLAGLHAALWQSGVQNIDLGAIVSDLVIEPGEAAFCSDISVVVGGRDV